VSLAIFYKTQALVILLLTPNQHRTGFYHAQFTVFLSQYCCFWVPTQAVHVRSYLLLIQSVNRLSMRYCSDRSIRIGSLTEVQGLKIPIRIAVNELRFHWWLWSWSRFAGWFCSLNFLKYIIFIMFRGLRYCHLKKVRVSAWLARFWSGKLFHALSSKERIVLLLLFPFNLLLKFYVTNHVERQTEVGAQRYVLDSGTL